MVNMINKPRRSDYLRHETKKHSLLRFFGLVLILIAYFTYVSIKMGPGVGFATTVLTWTFFIFCTPIADAGFILAFPIRLLTGFRMIYTQLIAFVLAFFIDIYAFFHTPVFFDNSIILKLFHQILARPYPFWGIIFLSLIGTVFSIYFGDELVDVAHHSERVKYHRHINLYKIIIFIFTMGATLILYNFLLKDLNVKIPLV